MGNTEISRLYFQISNRGRERAISLTSRLTPTYTTYGLFSTTSGLGVRNTGWPTGRTVGSTATPMALAEATSAFAYFSLEIVSSADDLYQPGVLDWQ